MSILTFVFFVLILQNALVNKLIDDVHKNWVYFGVLLPKNCLLLKGTLSWEVTEGIFFKLTEFSYQKYNVLTKNVLVCY